MTERRVILLALVLLLALVTLRNIVVADRVVPDGLNYLDMADAFRRGDFGLAINAYWSPLYPAVLAFALALTQATRASEPVAAHAANLIIFIGALLAFRSFLREFLRFSRRSGESAQVGRALFWVGWLLFAWSVLVLEPVELITPDLLALACYLGALGRFCAILSGAATRRTWLALGVWLGLAYLAKAVMLPAGIAALLALTVVVQRTQRSRVPIALLGLLLTAGPLIVGLSLEKKRPTFSEAGHYAYFWDVEHRPIYFPPGTEAEQNYRHPPRRVFQEPLVLEFATPLPVSHPLYYDPSYWYDGSQIHFSLRAQARSIARSIYYLLRRIWPLLLAALLLATGANWSRARVSTYAPLLLPALAGIALYLPFHIEARYLAPFLVPAALTSAALLIGASAWTARITRVLAGLALYLALQIGFGSARDVAFLAGRNVRPLRPNPDPILTAALRAADVPTNGPVGVIGYYGYWPRAASVRVITAAQPTEFWAAPPPRRACALHAMAATGARAVVSRDVPASARAEGWQPIAQTRAALHRLDDTAQPACP